MTFTKPNFVDENVSKLREERTVKGLLRQDLSLKTGLHEHSIQRYESGTRSPDKKSYNKLAEIFNWEKWE